MARTPRSSVTGYLSLLISCLALAVALSGTAYAALAKGEVKSKNLARAAVTSGKLKTGAVSTPKLREAAVTGSKLADAAVTAPKLAPNAVSGAAVVDGSLSAADLADNAVGAAELADDSVDSGAVQDRSIRLHDLGGGLVDQTTTLGTSISIAAGDCARVPLRLSNPAPAGFLGSMVVGTITTAAGGGVVNNAGFVVPTLVTATSQGGAFAFLGVCAGSSLQTIPVGSIVTWSVIAP